MEILLTSKLLNNWWKFLEIFSLILDSTNSCLTLLTEALAFPELLSLKRLSPSTAFLAWKPLRQENWNDQQGEYRVKLRENDALIEDILTSHSSSTELTLNNLKPNVTYGIQMSSCMNSECSAWSEVMELKPLHVPGSMICSSVSKSLA